MNKQTNNKEEEVSYYKFMLVSVCITPKMMYVYMPGMELKGGNVEENPDHLNLVKNSGKLITKEEFEDGIDTERPESAEFILSYCKSIKTAITSKILMDKVEAKAKKAISAILSQLSMPADDSVDELINNALRG